MDVEWKNQSHISEMVAFIVVAPGIPDYVHFVHVNRPSRSLLRNSPVGKHSGRFLGAASHKLEDFRKKILDRFFQIYYNEAYNLQKGEVEWESWSGEAKYPQT